jgi:hypothetical protein
MGRPNTEERRKKESILFDAFGRPAEKEFNPLVYSLPLKNDAPGLSMYYRVTLEAARIQVLADMEAMLSTFPAGPAESIVGWLGAGMPQVRFEGNGKDRAQTAYEELLYRIHYQKIRKDILFNAIFKEEFLLLEMKYDETMAALLKIWSASGGESDAAIQKFIQLLGSESGLAKINGIRHLPAKYTFKFFDASDRPVNVRKAYYQLADPMSGPTLPYFQGTEPPANSIFIPKFSMIHPRFKNLRWDNVWYSRPALINMREQFNRVQLMAEDSVLDSHFCMTPILVFYINALGKEMGANKDQIEKFKQALLGEKNEKWEQVVSAGSMVFLSGNDKAEMVNDGRLYSIRSADLQLQLDLLFMNSLFPAALTGFANGKNLPSGDALDMLKKHAEMMIRECLEFEWNEILYPLVEKELILNNIWDVRMTPTFPQTSFDSRTIQEKINASRVSNFTMSRKSAFEGQTAPTWDEEWKQILKELKEAKDAGVDVIPYREDTETTRQDVNKETQGSPGDGTVAPVAPKAKPSGSRKDEKNLKQGG